MATRRQFLNSTASAVSGLALSSCGWTLAQVRQSAPPSSASNKLYIYTWSNYTDAGLLKSFREQTGIEVIANVFDSNEAMLAKVRAGGGSEYSIISPSDYMVRQMSEVGLLSKLDHNRLDGLNNLLPRFQNPIYDPGNQHSIPISWGTTGLIYNTQKLKEAPTDWNYLWDNQEQLTQRITLINDVREVMGATLRMLGYSYNSTQPEQLQQAYEKLVALKPAIATFTSDAWRDQLVAGDLWLAMGYSADAITTAEENPNLRYVIPSSGTSLWTDTMVIPKSAPNPDAAYAWLNFILQPSIMAQVCYRLKFATPNQAAIKLLPPDIRNNTNLFPPDSILAKCEQIAPIGQFSEVYERYWTQLSSS
uniref:polyamine ABC transporter substrate-binding protein n=1 Tax=Trichocoleus desertorum TaxID=1481672 RepID=UPI0025B52056|nr:spermidine/putrescine ABC transporter substrate-binding protein [Trichocoleus desertorum]